MTNAHATQKRPTNLTLDAALVREARRYTKNLSATMEQMLADYVARERRQQREADTELDRVIVALDAVHATTGLLSDEFNAL